MPNPKDRLRSDCEDAAALVYDAVFSSAFWQNGPRTVEELERSIKWAAKRRCMDLKDSVLVAACAMIGTMLVHLDLVGVPFDDDDEEDTDDGFTGPL